MALNKLKLGTALSTQIAEQNANIEQIENFMITKTFPLVLASGVNSAGGIAPRVHKNGNVCSIRGRIKVPTAYPEGNVIATMPAECRPLDGLWAVVTDSSARTGRLYIRSSGVVSVYEFAPSSNTIYLEGISWIVGE